ncbi:EAL domain-containing protein [Thermomicrobium sp.]
MEHFPSRIVAQQDLETLLARLPSPAAALWLSERADRDYVLVASHDSEDHPIPLSLASQTVCAIAQTPDPVVLPIRDASHHSLPLFQLPGVLLPLRWRDGHPEGLLWMQLCQTPELPAAIAECVRLRPFLESLLDRVALALTLDELWRTSPIPTCMVDEQWTVIAANPAFQRLIDRPQAVGETLERLLPVLPSWRGLGARLAESHTLEDYPVLAATAMGLRRFSVRATTLGCDPSGRSTVLIQFVPDLVRNVLEPSCHFASAGEGTHAVLESPLRVLSRLLQRTLQTQQSVSLVYGLLHACTLRVTSFYQDITPSLQTTLTDLLERAIEPTHLIWLDAASLVAVIDTAPSTEVTERLREVLPAFQRAYPTLSAWPFHSRVTFVVTPLRRSSLSESALGQLLARLRELALSLDDPVITLSAEEADPGLPTQLEIARAVLDGQFSFVVQPIVPLNPTVEERFELLARLRVGQRILRPCLFLPLVDQLDRHEQLFRAALAVAQRYCAAGLSVHVNAPPTVLLRLHATGQVKDFGSASGGGHITLEITDEHALTDLSALANVLEHLRANGFSVALDDYGSGTHSCMTLATLPLDLIKIDRAVINLVGTPQGDLLVRAITETSHRLGLRVISEGVDRPSVAERLRSWHCDYVQGFAFGLPQPLVLSH